MHAPPTRRTRAVAILGTLVLAATACGGGDDPDPSTTSTTPAATGSGQAGGAVELSMYYPVAVGGPLTEVVDGLISDFEAEHSDINVEAVYSGSYAETMTKALTAARGGDAPDLAVLLSTELYTLLDEDLIVPFDDLVGEDGQEWLDGFFPALMANGQTADGTTWSIPFQRSTIVQYHNKDMFEEAGLDPEAPPATWDELMSMSKTIVDSGAAEFGIEIPTTDYPYWMFQALAIQNDTVLQNDTGTETYFDDPGALEALEYWLSLGEAGAAPPGTVEWATTPEDFLQGRTAMMWTSTGNLTSVKDNATFDFGVSMLPEHVRLGSPTGGGNLYIFKDTTEEERAAALELIQWLTAPEQAARWSIATGYIATSPAAWETDAMVEYAEGFPPATVARDQLEFAIPELSTHDNGRMYELVNDGLATALTGEQSAQEALASIQEQADNLLAQYSE